MSEPPIFDYEDALNRVSGDAALLRELLRLAEGDMEPMVERLRRAAGARNSAELASHAHALKGVLANLSAKRAFVAARIVEDDGLRGDFQSAEKSTEHLAAEIAAFVNEFRRRLAP